jgi:hypothetical protein
MTRPYYASKMAWTFTFSTELNPTMVYSAVVAKAI